jgi:hypothetical protein
MVMMENLADYYKIYQKLYENPDISLCQISKTTNIPLTSVSRYLTEMYQSSILIGPMEVLPPAHNYQYAFFLRCEQPVVPYIQPEYLCARSMSLTVGYWNLLVICETVLNTSLKGVTVLLHGVKGVTYSREVVSLDWDQSINHIYSTASPPTREFTLYEEIPAILWNHEEWALYCKLKRTVRTSSKQCQWFSRFGEGAHVYTAFYPHGLDQYFFHDFLFQSHYHTQLAALLGFLPSTSQFFSVGDYLLARVCFLNKKEKDDLFSLIHHLGEKGYYTHVYSAAVVSTW